MKKHIDFSRLKKRFNFSAILMASIIIFNYTVQVSAQDPSGAVQSTNPSVTSSSDVYSVGTSNSSNANNIANLNINSISFAPVIDKTAPAVVNISSVRKSSDKNKNALQNPPESLEDLFKFFMNPQGEGGLSARPTIAVGSGFIIDPTGYVVTNYHVIKDASEINVYIGNDKTKKYVATVIGKDPQTDLALVKIDPKGTVLPYLSFADSDKAKVGDFVIAIGNPFGLGGTVTHGIISAQSRSIDEYLMDEFIQTDAPINVGNSGGPLCDMNGNVVGINSVIYSQSGGNVGIGFAITSNMAQPIIDQLKKTGFIERGFIGVKVQLVNEDIAKSLGMPEIKGALINEITKDSPAEKIGLKVGDVIVSFNNKEVKNIAQLVRFVSSTPVGKDVPMQVWRNGKIINMSIAVKKRSPKDDEYESDSDESDDQDLTGQGEFLGMTLVNINDEVRNKYGLSKDSKGVLVLRLSETSPLIMSGIKPGDILVSIDQKPFNNLKEMNKIIADLKAAGRDTVLVLLIRNEDTSIFTTMNIKDAKITNNNGNDIGNSNSDEKKDKVKKDRDKETFPDTGKNKTYNGDKKEASKNAKNSNGGLLRKN